MEQPVPPDPQRREALSTANTSRRAVGTVPIGDELLARTARNQSLLYGHRSRMQLLRIESAGLRDHMLRLRCDLQLRRDGVRHTLASARSWTGPSLRVGPRPAVRSRQAVAAVDAHRRRLHDAYAASRDGAVRDELMATYDGFARSLVRPFIRRETRDDLVQVARIGLLHAIDRCDPRLGRPFLHFARITITGELKRHLRDRTWAIRIPRGLQEDYLAVMATVDAITAEEARSPSMEALAARSGLSIERVLEALDVRETHRPVSLDAPAGRDAAVIEFGAHDAGFGRVDNRGLLADLLGRLPERDRRIIELRFLHDMTQAEIAAEIGVSQMYVSRALARTLGRLRISARTAGAATG